MVDKGNFEPTRKVSENSGNSKINGYGNLLQVYFLEIVRDILSKLRLLLQERICSQGSKFFSLRVSFNFQVIHLALLKLSENDF